MRLMSLPERPNANDLVDWIMGVQELFQRVVSHAEPVLDHFDNQDGCLPDDEREAKNLAADVEAIRENADYGVEITGKAILWHG